MMKAVRNKLGISYTLSTGCDCSLEMDVPTEELPFHSYH